MGSSLTFSEIIWILVIILIIFGPQRLPEMARKAGRLAAKAREATSALQRQITEEYGDVVAPLKDVTAELKEAKRQLSDTARAAARDVEDGMKMPEFPPVTNAPGSTESAGTPVTGTPAAEGPGAGEPARPAGDTPAGDPSVEGDQPEPGGEGEGAPA